MTRAPEGWTPLRASAGAVIWHRGSLACVYYTGSNSEDDVVADFAAQQTVLSRYGELSQLVIFRAERIGRITAGARQTAAEQLRALGPKLRCSAIVLLGHGFAATLMRLAITSANLLGGAADRHRIFTALPEAIDWIEQYPGQHPSVRGVDPAALAAAIDAA